MSYLLIKNGKVIADGTIRRGDILVCDDKILEVGFAGEAPADCQVVDAKGQYVSPGFIDIHVHGGGGFDIMDCTEEAFCEVANIHLKNGTTTIVPTAVSAPMEDIFEMIEVCKKAIDKCPSIYGLHLEGPFLSVNQKGAHNEKLLHAPTTEETKRLLEVGEGIICRITAACELDNMQKFAQTMKENGIGLALGHSDATAAQALEGFQWGFSHITHLYSATPSVRKINQVVTAGVIEAAYLDDNVTVELIADGNHATEHGLKLAMKIKGTDKVVLVTDAIRPAGLDVTESYLGAKLPENRVIVEDGVAKLPDRSCFAGSVATMARVLKKSMTHYHLDLVDAIKMMTETPAKVLGAKDIGKIQAGFKADFVMFDEDWNISNVIKNGKVVVNA
jgi:N-acetylglucosamine-6-phosphate deacetylase